MSVRHLLSILDLEGPAVESLFEQTRHIKSQPRRFAHALDETVVALLSEKQSLRTRVTFEIGVHALGGYCVTLSPQDFVIGERESVPDIARNLDRWVDMIVARVYEQTTLEELARWGNTPVINALSDIEHPCQALTDFFTLYERGIHWRELRMAYVGDGNNVCHSLLLLGALLGATIRVASPPGYAPIPAIVTRARELARTSGAAIEIGENPLEAVRGATAVYTDTWISMGQEKQAEQRRQVFAAYQVNSQLLSAADPGAVVMHCLPAHRGEEITDEVIDGPQSIVFDQAENRLHMQKTIMLYLLGRIGCA